LTTAYNNYALLFAKDLLHKAELSRNLSLSVNSLSRQSLYLDPDVRFIRIKGNSVRKESNPSRRTAKSKVSSIRYLMLRPNWAGVSETAISSGVFFLLQSFKQGARVSSIVREMENHFSGRNTVTRERALRQIAEAVSGGVLWRTNVIARYAVYRRNKMGRDNLLYYP
jgi:hypothetical protein